MTCICALFLRGVGGGGRQLISQHWCIVLPPLHCALLTGGNTAREMYANQVFSMHVKSWIAQKQHNLCFRHVRLCGLSRLEAIFAEEMQGALTETFRTAFIERQCPSTEWFPSSRREWFLLSKILPSLPSCCYFLGVFFLFFLWYIF